MYDFKRDILLNVLKVQIATWWWRNCSY